MKHTCQRLLVAAAPFAVLAAARTLTAEPIAAESRISAVTVYVDRAIVTRDAKVTVPAGAQEVLFSGLPDSLDPDLLQVSGGGTAAATILDVRAEAVQLSLAANPRLATLQEQVRVIQAGLRKITDQTTVLQQQRDYLDRIKNASVTPPTAEGTALPKLAEWQQLVTYYTETLGQVLTGQQDLERQRDELKERLAAVQREINELQAPGERTVQNVIVRLDVAEAGELDLRLAYTVDDASWTPTYDVRVTSADKGISLGYAAMVQQSTSEDWVDVKLTLSTARPAIGGTPPELEPWYVDEVRPMRPAPAQTTLGSKDAAFELEASKMQAGILQRRDLSAAQAQVEAGLTSATFALPHPADIPSDNAPHKVAIATHPLEGELSCLTVPKLAELAYLRAAVKNTSEFPLIAGLVNLFLDGTYVARSEIDTVMPQEKFDLDLGVDDAISVERKLVNRLQENTGVISRNQRVTYDWLITVQNNRKTAEKILVKDHLPIAQHEKITVKLLAPPAAEVEKDEVGVLTWTLNLQPGEKRDLPLKISVEYPSDFAISGLE